ncbi:prepilin peptidase [Candidatus Kaiserbacteria bacterium]|nr:prepilin peptidase [Candidatus Kaiserbacteria bacterium]
MFDFVELVVLLPSWYIWLIAFGFGVVIGSFLNVFIYRLHTGKSLGGSSHCLSCATPLKWFELLPLLSYLALRGRCRTCGCHIPVRYFIVELVTGLLFVVGVGAAHSFFSLFTIWFVMAVLVVITVYDINHFIIPDGLTVAVLGGASLLLAERVLHGYPLEALWVDIAAAVAGAAFLFFLWFISKGQWLGFGDVKLAFPLGLLVGSSFVFSFIVLSFWVGALLSLLIMGWQLLPKRGQPRLSTSRQQLTMKSAVPFAPFLVAGCLLVYFTHFNVLSLFSF